MSLQKKLFITILATSLLFRFYNLKGLQFWYSDEEVNAMVVRKIIVEKKPILISPNSTTGLSLGPFYHLASTPIFYLSKMNLQITLAAMGLLGILTTLVVYQIGRSAKDSKFALVSSFLYSSSFVMGLFDRRWWPLALCPITSSTAIYSIYQIAANKKYLWSVPLVASLSFGFHADPTIGILTLSTAVTFLVLKIPILKKEYLLALVTFLIFLAPLAAFELRHPGTITHPVAVSLGKNTAPQAGKLTMIAAGIITKTGMIFSNSTFPKPSDFAERYVASAFTNYNSLLPYINLPTIIIALFLPLYNFRKFKEHEKTLLAILYSFFFSFLVGLFLYEAFYKKAIMQHYYTIVLPTFFLLLAFTITKVIKNRFALFSILAIYFIINFAALLGSSFKYPLYQKQALTKLLANDLGDSNFSLYQEGDSYVIGGGFPMLFILENKHPKKSNVYEYYDWMYQAHGLFTTRVEKTDQEKIVIISDKPQLDRFPAEKTLSSHQIGNLYSIILDNSDRWYKKN